MQGNIVVIHDVLKKQTTVLNSQLDQYKKKIEKDNLKKNTKKKQKTKEEDNIGKKKTCKTQKIWGKKRKKWGEKQKK